MNLLNLPDWNIEHVEDSARDYRVHATYGPEPGQCIHCGKGTLFSGKRYGFARALVELEHRQSLRRARPDVRIKAPEWLRAWFAAGGEREDMLILADKLDEMGHHAEAEAIRAAGGDPARSVLILAGLV